MLLLDQPLTSRQLAERLGTTPAAASFLLWSLMAKGVTCCLNPDATANRLHWLTDLGVECQTRMRGADGRPTVNPILPDLPWSLYGELLFRHRAAVVLALNGPVRACEIRRRAISRDPGLRMSANNTRDVMRFLVDRGVAKPATVPELRYPHFALTELGLQLRQLIERATLRST